MKKVKFIFLLIMILTPMSVFSATSLPKYEPYKDSEFQPWMKKLYRGEVIAFGATALAYPIVSLATNSAFQGSDTDVFFKRFGISFACGAVISLVDFLLGEFD